MSVMGTEKRAIKKSNNVKSSNYVLAEVYYNGQQICKIKYYSIFEQKFIEIPFALYYNKYRKILLFRNAYLVEGATSLGGYTAYFRARTHRDINSFKRIGGYDGSADFDCTPVKQEIKKGSVDGRGRDTVSNGNATETRTESTTDTRGTNGTNLFQRQFTERYSKPTNSSFIIRNVKKAETVTPQVFKGLFRQARNNLEPDVRWFVSIRNTEELKKFDCLVFNDEATNFPLGYIAVNKATGDIGALLRDKACEMNQFTLNALANVIIRGGNKLDCYTYPDKGLGYIYAKHGFMPVCRVRFDESKSERAIRKNVGRPDIVMFFLIETGQPKDFINDYVSNVENNLYPNYDEYTYVPYVDELPKWYQYGFEQGFDDYQTGLYIRDYMLNKWQTLRERYRGRECLFIQEQLTQ